MRTFAYYPGCSLEKTAKPYDDATKEVFRAINIGLNEVEDWNCCGATLSVGLDDRGSTYLCARNVALAAKQGVDLAVPCSACFTALKKAEYTMEDNPRVSEKVKEILGQEGLKYDGSVKIRHVLDILINEAEREIKSAVKVKLSNVKVAAYYGCQIVRPKSELDDPDNPETLDKLMAWIGTTPTFFSMRSKCCGGMVMQTKPGVAEDMVRDLIISAKQGGAECIVTACPLCQMNLEAYQSKISKKYKKDLFIPILYFTQMMGYAFGIDPKKLGIADNFVSAKNVLAKAGGK